MKNKFNSIKDSISKTEIDAIFRKTKGGLSNNELKKEFITRCSNILGWNIPLKSNGKNIGKWDLPQSKYNDFIIENWDYTSVLPVVRQMSIDLEIIKPIEYLEKNIQDAKNFFATEAKDLSVYTGIEIGDYASIKPYHAMNYDQEVVRKFVYASEYDMSKISYLNGLRMINDFIFTYHKEIAHLNNTLAEAIVFYQNENIIPTLGNANGVDYFIDGIPFDQKTSSSVGNNFIKDHGDDWESIAKQSPELVGKSLYEYQGAARFSTQPRVYIVSGIKTDKSIQEQLKETHTIHWSPKIKESPEGTYKSEFRIAFV